MMSFEELHRSYALTPIGAGLILDRSGKIRHLVKHKEPLMSPS